MPEGVGYGNKEAALASRQALPGLAAQEAKFASEVGEVTELLHKGMSPLGLAEMGVNPQALDQAMEVMKQQEVASLAKLGQLQKGTGQVNFQEQMPQGLAGQLQ